MLEDSEKVEVIASKDGKDYKSIMIFGLWKVLKKKNGFSYRAYQIGFSQFKLENDNKN